MSEERIYRVTFHNRGEVYELYARKVASSALYAFVEVEGLMFGERSEIVVDPSEERLKSEFEGVQRTYIPMHAVVRIDEVAKRGANRVVGKSEPGKVTPFPLPGGPRGGEPV